MTIHLFFIFLRADEEGTASLVNGIVNVVSMFNGQPIIMRTSVVADVPEQPSPLHYSHPQGGSFYISFTNGPPANVIAPSTDLLHARRF